MGVVISVLTDYMNVDGVYLSIIEEASEFTVHGRFPLASRVEFARRGFLVLIVGRCGNRHRRLLS